MLRRKEYWCWYHRECGDQQGSGTNGEMAGEDHCRMHDDPPTDGMCHLRLRTPDGWGGGRKGSFQRRDSGWSGRRPDDNAVRCWRFQCAHRCG